MRYWKYMQCLYLDVARNWVDPVDKGGKRELIN